VNPIPYGRQDIDQTDIDAVVETLKANFLTQGPKISEFEDAFAQYVGSTYAVAVSNGTAALHLANLALGVKPEDKVITTPITFAASANASRYVGADVTFVDIDPETLCIDISKVKKLLESNPKGTFSGITPVDFAGFPVDLSELKKLADEYGIWIIEDACHAPGGFFINAENEKQFCGNGKLADLSVFSFHPVKHIATGEGGMVTTDSKKLYEKLCLFRTHGITKSPDLLEENHGGWYYEMQELGYNYRITDIQAALGITQLAKADIGLEKRRAIAQRYNKAFKNTGVTVAKSNQFMGNAFHLYVIQVEDRKGLYEHLRSKSIYAQVHYAPVHLMPYYKQFGWTKGDLPMAEAYYEKCLSLPMFPTLTDEEQQFVIDSVLEFVK
jgi:UDP-4-amino-4,6-dideoxy-N-acetyl-beta-L-altrosamine transaminase